MGRWIERCLEDVRPQLSREPDPGNLFLTHLGDPMGLNSISSIVHDYIKATGIRKSGSCHLFRHTMATLMLEGGADIRYVQAMLGHENIQSTEIYTHVATGKRREIHAATHPGAKLRPHEIEGSGDVRSEQLTLFEESSSEEKAS